jgi:hypothetical protein
MRYFKHIGQLITDGQKVNSRMHSWHVGCINLQFKLHNSREQRDRDSSTVAWYNGYSEMISGLEKNLHLRILHSYEYTTLLYLKSIGFIHSKSVKHMRWSLYKRKQVVFTIL